MHVSQVKYIFTPYLRNIIMASSTSLKDVTTIESFIVEFEGVSGKTGHIYGQGQNEVAIRIKLQLKDINQNAVIPTKDDLYNNIYLYNESSLEDYPREKFPIPELGYTKVRGAWVGLVGSNLYSEVQDYGVDDETVSIVFYAYCYKPLSSYRIAARIHGTSAEAKTTLSGNNNQFVTLETLPPEDYSKPARWELLQPVDRVIQSSLYSGKGISGDHHNGVITYRVWSLHCRDLKPGHHLVGHKNYQKRESGESSLDLVNTYGSQSGLNDPTWGRLKTWTPFDSATLDSGESGYKLWLNWVEPAAGGTQYSVFGIDSDSTVGGGGYGTFGTEWARLAIGFGDYRFVLNGPFGPEKDKLKGDVSIKTDSISVHQFELYNPDYPNHLKFTNDGYSEQQLGKDVIIQVVDNYGNFSKVKISSQEYKSEPLVRI
jgi:hypothetical protein